MPTIRERLAAFLLRDIPSTAIAERKSGVSLTGFDFVSNGMGTIHYANGFGPSSETSPDLETAFAVSVLCYAAIRYRAQNVSQPPLGVFEVTDEGATRVPHPLDEVLAEPSEEYDMGETMWLTQASLDIFGRALWVGTDVPGRLPELMPWNGNEFRIKDSADRLVDRFEIRTRTGTWTPIEKEAAILFRYLSPYSRHSGVSPTQVAMSWLGLGARTKAAVDTMMARGMFPSVVIQPHQDWAPTEDELEDYIARLEQFHQGPANAGTPFVALGGGSVSRVAFSLRDMLPDETLDRIEATVASAFGVAPVILGFLVGLRNSPWSQMGEARRFTYEDTIEPLWASHAKTLTRQLLRRLQPESARAGLEIRFDTSEVTALQDDRSELIEDAVKATFWTLDERRVHTGQEPLGGEVGEWVEAISRPQPVPMLEENADAREIEAKRDTRAWSWSMFDVMTKAQESTWGATVEQLFGKAESRVMRAIRSQGFADLWPGTKKAAPDVETLLAYLMDATAAEVEWDEPITSRVAETATVGALALARTHGIDFALADRAAIEYARRHAAELVTGVTNTTRSRLRDLIVKGLENGDSTSALAERIRGVGPFSKARANLIARTEVTTITNASGLETMLEFQADTGARVEKSWLSARDARVRPEHVELDNESYQSASVPFPNGLMVPGEPGCRCTAIYRVRTDDV